MTALGWGLAHEACPPGLMGTGRTALPGGRLWPDSVHQAPDPETGARPDGPLNVLFGWCSDCRPCPPETPPEAVAYLEGLLATGYFWPLSAASPSAAATRLRIAATSARTPSASPRGPVRARRRPRPGASRPAPPATKRRRNRAAPRCCRPWPSPRSRRPVVAAGEGHRPAPGARRRHAEGRGHRRRGWWGWSARPTRRPAWRRRRCPSTLWWLASRPPWRPR